MVGKNQGGQKSQVKVFPKGGASERSKTETPAQTQACFLGSCMTMSEVTSSL
jgi:hypothetical protein